MKKIFSALLKNIEAARPSLLVTVINVTGSSPGTKGAKMLVGEEGRLAGTIGGGSLEYQAINAAKELLKKQQGTCLQYDLTKEAAGLGMICGGKVEVLFSYIAPTAEYKLVAQTVLNTLSSRKTGWLLLFYSGQKISFVSDTEEVTGKYYVEKVQNSSRVFVFGGGHLAQEVVPLLSHLGFICVVTDDRAAFSTRELFPTAEAVYTRSFIDLAGHYDVEAEDYIVVVTRGHEGDFEVERFALQTAACYIGVVGSKAKTAALNAKLLATGYTAKDLARVTAPIGLNIGSETPAEIAVSIAAQLIQVRAKINIKYSCETLAK